MSFVEDKWRDLIADGYSEGDAWDIIQEEHKFMADMYFENKVYNLLLEIAEYLHENNEERT